MCRLMAYIGHPMLVADVVLWPDRSIIKQSYDARERLQDPSLPHHLGFGNLNGDGFGIGWFNTEERREEDPSPCMFKSITPAWNNENLARLSTKIVSPVIFAHVRAAYPGMPVSEQNCHPFQFGRYLWMHNGVVGGFTCIRRHLLAELSDAAYNTVQSFHSDSAVSFSIFLNALPNMTQQQPPDVLLRAMQDTIATITRVQRERGVSDTSLLNFVVSDGTAMVATRFVSPENGTAATLYYAEGATFARQTETAFARTTSITACRGSPTGGSALAAAGPCGAAAAAAGAPGSAPGTPGSGEDGSCRAISGTSAAVGSSVLGEASYSIAYGERGAGVAFVASEPITGSNTDWVAVPKNTALVITREKGGYINIMRSPLAPALAAPGAGPDPVQQEVATCLEAIIRGIATRSRAWVAKRSPLSAAAAGAALDNQDSMLCLTRTLSSEVPPVAAEEDHRLTGHGGAVLAVAVDESARRLYSACTDAAVRVWDLETMECVHVLRGHSKPVTQLRLARGRLYTAAGGAIRIWDTATLKMVDRVQTSLYSGGIRSMLVTDDGTIFVGHSDTTVKMYRTEGAADGASTTPPPASPRRGSHDGATAAGAHLPPRPQPPHAHHAPAVAAAGATAAAAAPTPVRGEGGLSAALRSSPSLGSSSPLKPPPLATAAAAGSMSGSPADGSAGSGAAGPSLAAALAAPSPAMSCDEALPRWTRTASGFAVANPAASQAGAPPPAAAGVTAAAVAAAAGAVPPSLPPATVERVPDAVTDTACGHVGPVNSLVVCGQYICSAGGDATVRIWRASDLAPVRVLRGHRGSVLCLLAVGHLLLSGARDNAIRVWDLEMDMMCRRTLLGHKDDVTSLSAIGLRRRGCGVAAFDGTGGSPGAGGVPASPRGSSPRGSSSGAMLAALVASASADGTVRVWCAPSWVCIRVLVSSPPLGPSTPPGGGGVMGGGAGVQQGTASHLLQAAFSRPAQLQHLPPVAEPPVQILEGADGDTSAANAEASVTAAGPGAVAAAAPPHPPHPPLPPGAGAAAAAAALRLPQRVAPLRIGHSSFASFDFSGDDFSFGGSHASRPSGAIGPVPVSQYGAVQQPAQTQVGFVVDGGASAADGRAQKQLAAAVVTGASPPAALCVAVARGMIFAGFVDGAVRLWHVDGMCAAAAEVVGATLPSTPPGGAAGAAAMAGGLEHALSIAGGDLRSFASQPQHAGFSLAASPPMSPPGRHRLATVDGGGLLMPSHGSLAGTASGGALRAATSSGGGGGAAAALHHGGGSGADAHAAGAMCARLRAGTRTAAETDAPHSAAGHCDACGSMDQQLVRALRELVAIRTVSSSEKLRDECLRGAKYLARLLEGLGCEVRLAAHAEGKNPVVMGRLGWNPAHPTVVFYGHYDVQPALEPDWATRPFELAAVDGYLYGRGTSDNKGPVLAFIYAVKEMLDCWQASGVQPPINVAFIIEGEEENGSTGFVEALEANLPWFADAALVVISNTVWVGERLPCLTYGMRGMVTASIEVSGPARDVHSGNDGGVFSEPMADLFKLLASLTAAPGDAAANGSDSGSGGSSRANGANGGANGGGGSVAMLPRPGGGGSAGMVAAAAAARRAAAAAAAAAAARNGGANGSNGTGSSDEDDVISVGSGRVPTAPAVTGDAGDTGDTTAEPSFSINDASAVSASTAANDDSAVADGGANGSSSSNAAGGCACDDGGAVGTRIMIPGFYDGVRPRLIDLAWAGLEECDEFSMETYQRAIGVPRLTAPPNKHDLLVARWCQPSLSVVEVRAGGGGGMAGDERALYRFGPTRFSVIPRTAVGKVSIRFVPEQDASHLIAALTRHVRAEFSRLGSANSVSVHVHSVGDWWEADPESAVFKMAERAVRREWGVAPLYVREGGTMPVASLIEKMLGAPALLIPMGQSSDNCHLANERLRRLNLIKGKNVVRHLMEELVAAGVTGVTRPGDAGDAVGLAAATGGSMLRGGSGEGLGDALAPPPL